MCSLYTRETKSWLLMVVNLYASTLFYQARASCMIVLFSLIVSQFLIHQPLYATTLNINNSISGKMLWGSRVKFEVRKHDSGEKHDVWLFVCH